jgi:hypothetical protein
VLELQHIRSQRNAEEPIQAHRLPVCPYKGLAAYGPDDAAYLVGRERLVAETLARLVGAELLAVVGPSGSGKSLLVRAGLLPALAAGTPAGHRAIAAARAHPGDRPAEALDRALADLPSQGRTLLVVDQLEELFTLAVVSQRQAFVDRLVEALRYPYADVVAVVTLRSDYYGPLRRLCRPGQAGPGHHCAGRCDAVAFSPDGRLLATAGLDGSMVLWDLARRAPIRPLLDPDPGGSVTASVTAVAFTPGRPHARLGGGRRHGPPDRGPRRQGAVRAGRPRPRSPSLDGKLLAASAFDGKVQLWDPHTGEVRSPGWVAEDRAVLSISSVPTAACSPPPRARGPPCSGTSAPESESARR